MTRRLLNSVASFMWIQLWCLFLDHSGLELKDKAMLYMSPVFWCSASVFGCQSRKPRWKWKPKYSWLLSVSVYDQTGPRSIFFWSPQIIVLSSTILNAFSFSMLFFPSQWGTLCHFSTMNVFSFHWNAMGLQFFKLKTECFWEFISHTNISVDLQNPFLCKVSVVDF